MAEGYEVILDDLRRLADSFDREAISLEELRPKANQYAPDTGDGDLNGTLGDVLDNLSTLFQILVDTLRSHAGKLRSVHDTYQRTEEDTHALYGQMQDALKDG
jgi:hypothetical protein